MCTLAPKLHVNPLPVGIDIRYNTVRQEALPRMDTGQCLLLFNTNNNYQNSLVLVIHLFFK